MLMDRREFRFLYRMAAAYAAPSLMSRAVLELKSIEAMNKRNGFETPSWVDTPKHYNDALCGTHLRKFRQSYGDSGEPTKQELQRIGEVLAANYPNRGDLLSNVTAAISERIRIDDSKNTSLAYVNIRYLAEKTLFDADYALYKKLEWFYPRVAPEGVWDYKFRVCADFISIGNFNYGLAGKALGIPTQLLLDMAGAAQIASSNWESRYGLPGGAFPGGDDPRDSVEVRAGIAFFDLQFGTLYNKLKRQYLADKKTTQDGGVDYQSEATSESE
jgi:hypothetical protein